MANNKSAAIEAIHRGRTRLLSKAPFYGYLAMRLKLREMNEQPTCATDGEYFYFNSDFVVSLTKTQLEATIAHEVEHVYLQHPLRGFDLTKGDESLHPIAMFAADMAINPHLKDGGFDLMQDSVFPEKQYWSDSFEQHYKRLKKSAKKVVCKMGGGCSGVKPQKGKDGKDLTDAERKRIEDEIKTATLQAATFAKAAGKLPADLERLIGDIRAPKVAWYEVLRRFMQAVTKNDYRMMPPNRRYVYQGLYLPSLRSETVEHVLFIMDGSGSTWNVFDQFIAECIPVLTDIRPEHFHVMVWDTRCSWYREFDTYHNLSAQDFAALKRDFGAGGGSDFQDCFNWFNRETGVTPQLAVVLTDMEIYWPEDPGYPVLWVATTDTAAPFGEVTRIEANE